MPVQVKMESFENVLYSPEGEFANSFKSIRQRISQEKLNKFCSLTTEAQLKFLQEIPETNLKVSPTDSIKNLEKALEFKEQGNDFFRSNNYGEAYKFYTKALQHCPVDELNPADPKNKQYSIIWANRSAALDGAGLYAACIHDIDTALKFGYPRELWYKIYKRKGHAAIKMKQYLIAKEALEISLKNVGRSDIKKEKDRDNYRMKVRKQMTVFNVTKTLYNVDVYEQTPSTLADGAQEDRGLSKKVDILDDGGKRHTVAQKDINAEDVLAAMDPYVAVVNVSGGRAGGKICPHTLEKMFHPIPCQMGSEALFGSEKARTEANRSYHQYEWRILSSLLEAGLMEKVRLALRMVTLINPEDVASVSAVIEKGGVPAEHLHAAVQTFRLPVTDVSEEETLVSSVLALYLTRHLQVSGYVRTPSKSGDFNAEELQIYGLLNRAILVALRHTRRIEILDVPKEKKDMGDEVVRDTCGFGIYPDLSQIEEAGTGDKSHVISWFVDKKMVFSSFRKLEKGSKVVFFSNPPKDQPVNNKPNDMITFRCANELCNNYFPLKENTKEKIISCPIDECGLKTNIWERLKLIQRLKKDFASAKEEFSRNEVVLAKDILRDTIDEWDRIIIRPYREVTQAESLYVKCLLCMIGDQERKLVEGNQMGRIQNNKKPVNVMEENKSEESTAVVKV